MPSPHPSSQLRPHPSFIDSQFALVLAVGRAGAIWRRCSCFSLLGAAVPPQDCIYQRLAPRAGDATGDTARGCWGSIRSRCTSPPPPRAPSHQSPGIFLERIGVFFRRAAVCAVERGSTQAYRSCLLVGHSAPL
jgi:hypothetical protein